MPRLIRTPEEIFRTEKKDLYVIHSSEKVDSGYPGLKVASDWIASHLPGTAIEQIAPSEYSGFISGNFARRLRVDFTEEGLQAFCERWEKNNESIDPRFQCFTYPYERWLMEHGSTVATAESPTGKGPVVWIHTPSGFLGHQFTETDEQGRYRTRHPSNQRDLWSSIVESFPSLAALDPAELLYGNLFCTPEGEPKVVTYVRPLSEILMEASMDVPESSHPTAAQIRDWLLLPVGVKIVEDDF